MNTDNQNLGFTLIETFVAITILTVAVIGPLGVLSRAIADSAYAKNQITAYYLAQDGLELVINKRYKNLQGGQDWLSGLELCISSCIFDVESDNAIRANISDPAARLFQNNEKLYIHDDRGNPTPFARVLSIETISGGGIETGAIIKSTISWNYLGNTREFTLSSFIANY